MIMRLRLLLLVVGVSVLVLLAACEDESILIGDPAIKTLAGQIYDADTSEGVGDAVIAYDPHGSNPIRVLGSADSNGKYGVLFVRTSTPSGLLIFSAGGYDTTFVSTDSLEAAVRDTFYLDVVMLPE